jgi:FAD/FMN-containing dehydrogenase
MAAEDTSFQALASTIRGCAYTTQDPEYAKLKGMWNGDLTNEPKYLIQPRGAADVVKVLKFAHESKLDLVTRNGGHSFSGHSTSVCYGTGTHCQC